MYETLVHSTFPKNKFGQYMSQSNRKYEEALKTFPSPDPSEVYEDLPALGKELTHNTLLLRRIHLLDFQIRVSTKR